MRQPRSAKFLRTAWNTSAFSSRQHRARSAAHQTIVALLKTIEMTDQRVLLLVAEGDTNLQLSPATFQNHRAECGATNASDVLRAEALVCTRAAWDELMVRVDGGTQTEVAA
jgi:FixJ family two-component response regulator